MEAMIRLNVLLLMTQVNSMGIVTTLAGVYPSTNFGGDGRLASLASLLSPTGVEVSSTGDVYIADRSHQMIRKA